MSDGTFEQIADAYPLTPLQQGMLFHILSDPAQAHYVGKITATLHGPLTHEAAQRAWQVLLDRHEALRTAFVWENLDYPMQIVHTQASINVGWIEDDEDVIGEPAIDISQTPLMHVQICAQGPEQFKLIWHVHHLIADGWSAAVILQEFVSLLNGDALEAAPVFAEHAAWLDSLDHDADQAFWTDYFGGYSHRSLNVRGDDAGFDVETIALKADTLLRVSEMATHHKVTAATVYQTAFAQALGVQLQTRDVLFGVATSGRSSPVDGAETCVGLFVNTLPVRVDLTSDHVLEDVERRGLALRGREHCPQASLARYSGTPAGQNMVEAILSLRSTPAIVPIGAFSISDFAAQTPSNFPLTVEIDPMTGSVSALYDRAVLDTQTIRRFLLDFENTLTNGLEQSGGERATHTLDAVDVLGRFLSVSAENPNSTALTDATTCLTFDEVRTTAQSIAAGLIAQGVGAGDRVALVLPRNVEFVTAMLGVLMAGATYVPVDESYPADRVAAILADCDPKCILRPADVATFASFDPVSPVRVPPETAAYIIYTSGSTGTPKGVEISRGSLAASQAARDQFYPEPPEAFLLMSPFAFDSSVVGIYWSLTSGANLVISPKGAEQDMAEIGRLVSDQQVTHSLMLPTLYDAMLRNTDTLALDSLRQIIVAGEPCPQTLPPLHAQLLPQCYLANEYGPTEATVWATASLNAPENGAPLSIGHPIPGMDVFLLDEAGQEVPQGQVGELALAGPGLATGYFRRPTDTCAAFTSHTLDDGTVCRIYRTGDRARCEPDGQLTYLGRGDRQVKIRGHRIELDEVEAAIAALDMVRGVSLRAVPSKPATLDVLEATLSCLSPQEVADLISKAKAGS